MCLCVCVGGERERERESATRNVMDLIFLSRILEVIKGKVSDLAGGVSALTLCSPHSLALICLMGEECTF